MSTKPAAGYSTNPIKRLIGEIKRRAEVVGIFPNEAAITRLVAEIEERVNAFLTRPIKGECSPRLRGGRPSLWIDVTCVKVREGGRIVSTAAIIAVGVNTDGRREVLGAATGPSEAEPCWKAFLRSLADRGLRGVTLVIADDHKPVLSLAEGGLRAAASKVFAPSQQRFRVH